MLKTLFAVLVSCCMFQSAAWGQVRKLHTRDMTRLSQPQIAEYLKRSDVVFIPVGSVETNGIFPSDQDYTSALGYAMAMAEETDSLFMPGLIWSFPGTTVIAPSTIYLPPAAGTSYLKILAKSLLRQGFRRQVWISSGHGPAPLTVGTLVREFFEEKRVPILYIDMDTYLPKLKIPAESRSKVLYGAHSIANRIEDLPLKGDYGSAESKPAGAVPVNHGLAKLGEMGLSGSMSLGSWVPDVMAHGAGHEPVLAADAAERERWARQGREQIAAILRQMHLPAALNALREHDRFTQDVIIPKLGARLPAVDAAQ